MASRTWNSRINWSVWGQEFKRRMLAPQTGWPFLVSTGLYLALITKTHLGLSEEARQHSLYANRTAIKEHAHHEMMAYKKQVRLVQLLHARALAEETPAAPAHH